MRQDGACVARISLETGSNWFSGVTGCGQSWSSQIFKGLSQTAPLIVFATLQFYLRIHSSSESEIEGKSFRPVYNFPKKFFSCYQLLLIMLRMMAFLVFFKKIFCRKMNYNYIIHVHYNTFYEKPCQKKFLEITKVNKFAFSRFFSYFRYYG